jgi:hypothetical protein
MYVYIYLWVKLYNLGAHKKWGIGEYEEKLPAFGLAYNKPQ